MNISPWMVGAFSGFAAIALIAILLKRIVVAVEPFSSTLILRFGKVLEALDRPGLHVRPSLLIPGYSRIWVSRADEGMRFSDLHVNDRDGTTLRIDLWCEFRISDPRLALFGVEDWKSALRGILKHAFMSAAGTRQFESVIADRASLVDEVRDEAAREGAKCGIEIRYLCIQDIRVLPEISRQLFERVAAEIEMEKARIEEDGRIAIHRIEAETERSVAELRAQARVHASLAVGRAYVELQKRPKIMASFEELHRYSVLQPGKTVAFHGFGDEPLSVLDAAMLPEAAAVPMKEQSLSGDSQLSR